MTFGVIGDYLKSLFFLFSMALFHLGIERTFFYARERQDIADVIDFYKGRERKAGIDTRQDSFSVKVTSGLLDTIAPVEMGWLRFHVGPILLSKEGETGEDDNFFRVFKVLPDFSVEVSYEASAHFALFRRQLSLNQRGNLYKGKVDNSLFGGLYYVPKDVVEAMVSFDLSDFLKEGKKFRDAIASINHPNIRL